MNVEAKRNEVRDHNEQEDPALQAERRDSLRYIPASTSASLHMRRDPIILAQGSRIAAAYVDATSTSSSTRRLRGHSAVATVLLMSMGKLPLVLAQSTAAQKKLAFQDWTRGTIEMAITVGLTDIAVDSIKSACAKAWPSIKAAKQAPLNRTTVAAIEVCSVAGITMSFITYSP